MTPINQAQLHFNRLCNSDRKNSAHSAALCQNGGLGSRIASAAIFTERANLDATDSVKALSAFWGFKKG
jgi:hypothetical protein